MEHYAGIDVSPELSSLCVLYVTGKIIPEAKVASEMEALAAFLHGLGLVVGCDGLSYRAAFNSGKPTRPFSNLQQVRETDHQCLQLLIGFFGFSCYKPACNVALNSVQNYVRLRKHYSNDGVQSLSHIFSISGRESSFVPSGDWLQRENNAPLRFQKLTRAGFRPDIDA